MARCPRRCSICHRSKLLAILILYGREPLLPIDVNYSNQEIGENEQFDVAYVQHVVDVMCNIRAKVVGDVEDNIKEAQEKQSEAYNRRHKGKYTFKAGDKVLLRNLKRADRKGKSSIPWIGPYIVEEAYENGTCSLSGKEGLLKGKQNMCNLKMYVEREREEEQQNTLPAEDILDDGVPTADASREWLPHRNLCVEDKVAIATDQELNDKVIDACQAILKQKNNISGLESSLLCQVNGCMSIKSAEGYNNVQIHFDSDRGHWVTSSTLRNNYG